MIYVQSIYEKNHTKKHIFCVCALERGLFFAKTFFHVEDYKEKIMIPLCTKHIEFSLFFKLKIQSIYAIFYSVLNFFIYNCILYKPTVLFFSSSNRTPVRI